MKSIDIDYNKQAEQFLAKFVIKFRATLNDSKPAPWKDDDKIASGSGHHYRVTLSKDQREHYHKVGRITFDFWGSVADAKANKRSVDAYDVLACISSDVHCPNTFQDFCDEYSYPIDSIKALQTFRRCSSFAKRLKAFFTAEEIEALSEIQ
jgi:hypothetical protein